MNNDKSVKKIETIQQLLTSDLLDSDSDDSDYKEDNNSGESSDDTINTEDTFSESSQTDSDMDEFIEKDVDYATRRNIDDTKVKMLRSLNQNEFEEYVIKSRKNRSNEIKQITDKFQTNESTTNSKKEN